jgi:hypothetical protein
MRDEGRDRKKDIRKTGNQGAGKQGIRETGEQGAGLAGLNPPNGSATQKADKWRTSIWIPAFAGMTN